MSINFRDRFVAFQVRLAEWNNKSWKFFGWQRMLMIVGAIVYVVLFITYFVSPSTALKYATTLLPLALLPLAPELLKKPHELVAIVVVISVGVAAVQIFDDAEKDKRLEAVRIQTALTLDLVEGERKLRERERVSLHPRDAASALQSAPDGLRGKAERLSILASLAESRLLAGHAQLASRVLNFSENPDELLGGYEALCVESRDPTVGEGIEAVLLPLRRAVAYRNLGQDLADSVVPAYKSLVSEIDNKQIDLSDASARLGEIETKLASKIDAYPIAGLFNHLGVLAMAQDARERALARFYAALAAEPDHIPAYDSVAYAAWALNTETRTALKYAGRGIKLAEEFPKRLADEYQEIARNYAVLQSGNAALAATLDTRKSRISAQVERLQPSFMEGRGMMDRLQLTFAYCSALETINKDRARDMARRLYSSDDKDGEYQDAYGVVLLAFANTSDELDEADRLLKAAFGNPKSEEMTKKLAFMHRGKLSVKRAELGFTEGQ